MMLQLQKRSYADAFKTASKKLVQKTAKFTVYLIGKKTCRSDHSIAWSKPKSLPSKSNDCHFYDDKAERASSVQNKDKYHRTNIKKLLIKLDYFIWNKFL